MQEYVTLRFEEENQTRCSGIVSNCSTYIIAPRACQVLKVDVKDDLLEGTFLHERMTFDR